MFFVLDFIVHYLLHVSVPIGGHLQEVCNTKNSKAVIAYAFEFFVLQTT
jgi:hypothetical protein